MVLHALDSPVLRPPASVAAHAAYAPVSKIPLSIVHHSRNDPRGYRGGVEAFGRNLALIFEDVRFTWTGCPDIADVVARRLPVVCDNQTVLDYPSGYPLIGFQHGVAHVKAQRTNTRTDRKLATAQAKAARRDRVLWVACAQWIADTFAELHGNGAKHVVYHPVDVDRFHGRRDHAGSRVVLHDARTEHKGQQLVERLARAFRSWSFESLDCEPHQVPDRMARSAAFLHLSRYEGNSIVCNEAMAMNLPCLLTCVGLMNDGTEQFDVDVVDADLAFGSPDALQAEVARFLDRVERRTYEPRRWVLTHATAEQARQRWLAVMRDFARMTGWPLDLPAPAPAHGLA